MSDRLVRSAARVAPLLLAAALAAPVQAQTWRTVSSARQLWDKEPLSVQIQYGAGELKIGPAAQSMLYRMEMRYDEDHFRPVTDFDAGKRTLRLGTRSTKERSIQLEEGSRATIALSREVPLDMDLEFGAGEAEIDLGGMALRRLDLSTGASETVIRFGTANPIQAERVKIEAGAADLRVLGLGNTRAARIDFQGGVGSTVLDFGGAWDRSAEASVQMGIGSVTLRFPRGLGVRVDKKTFLTSFDSQGLIKRGDSYYSPDWDTAAHRLTVEVNAAFGSIDVEWIG